jgi:hypothetical protein
VCILVYACAAEPAPSEGGESSGSSGSAPGTDGTSTSGEPASSSTSTSSGLTSSSTSAGTTDASSSGGPSLDPPTCVGSTSYECANGRDDDGDGLVDLDDPDCMSPCDYSEDALSTGQNWFNDCRVDCAFDSNEGMGDDGCMWDLRCDPASPGELVGCGHFATPVCENLPSEQTPECRAACEPWVPPGCDCFGCCEVEIDGFVTPIYIDGSPDCSFDDLESCPLCNPRIDACGNPCDAAGCELCFGEHELPPGCDTNVCDTGDPCTTHGDCDDGGYCLWGCCYPPPA